MGYLKKIWEFINYKDLTTFTCCDNPNTETINDKTYCINCGTEYK